MASKPSESKAEGPATDSQVQVEKEIVASVYPEIVHHEFQNQCLIKLKKEQEKLRNDFLNRQKLIKELELQKQEKELRLQNLQSSIDNKSREVETEKRLKDDDFQAEREWQEKLKSAKKNKLASVLRYQNRMALLRNEVFSPQNLGDEKINEEIENLLHTYDDTCLTNNMLQLNIAETEKNIYSENEVNGIIEGMNFLIRQLKLETANDRKISHKMQTVLTRMEDEIKKITNEK